MLLAELCMTQPARLRDSTVHQPAGGRRPYWNHCPAHWSRDTDGHFLLVLLSSSFLRTFLPVICFIEHSAVTFMEDTRIGAGGGGVKCCWAIFHV